MSRYLMLGVSLAYTVACSPAASAQIRPGTYAFRLCRVTCDPRYPKNTFRTGWIVLSAAPLDLANYRDSARKGLEGSSMMNLYGRPANGCFRFTSNRPAVSTYAALAGVLHWERVSNGDSVVFELYHSDDAGHEVHVVATPSGFAGSGHSWGAGVASVDYPDDIVVGKYLGPPNVARCEEAGYAFLAEMRDALAHSPILLAAPCDSARAARVALDSVNKVYDLPSTIHRFEWDYRGDGIRIVTMLLPTAGVRDGMAIVRLDDRCRIRSLALRDSA